MHWILTQPRDLRGAELLDLLVRTGTPHDVVAGGPEFGTIVPDVAPDGPVLCFGSHALIHVAKAKGWEPGAMDVDWLGYAESIGIWGERMLNADARFSRFGGLPHAVRSFGAPRVFVRPGYDSKAFEACLVDADDVDGWVSTLPKPPAADVPSLACLPKQVMAEWRTWIVSGQVATASLYRRGGKALLDGRDTPEDMLAFAQQCADVLSDRAGDEAPPAYVLDVALSEAGYRIVEVNGFAGARLYDCDVNRLFGALNELAIQDAAPRRIS